MQTFKIPATRTCGIKQQRNNIRPIFEPINLKNYYSSNLFQANNDCIITFRSWNYLSFFLRLISAVGDEMSAIVRHMMWS